MIKVATCGGVGGGREGGGVKSLSVMNVIVIITCP